MQMPELPAPIREFLEMDATRRYHAEEARNADALLEGLGDRTRLNGALVEQWITSRDERGDPDLAQWLLSNRAPDLSWTREAFTAPGWKTEAGRRALNVIEAEVAAHAASAREPLDWASLVAAIDHVRDTDAFVGALRDATATRNRAPALRSALLQFPRTPADWALSYVAADRLLDRPAQRWRDARTSGFAPVDDLDFVPTRGTSAKLVALLEQVERGDWWNAVDELPLRQVVVDVLGVSGSFADPARTLLLLREMPARAGDGLHGGVLVLAEAAFSYPMHVLQQLESAEHIASAEVRARAVSALEQFQLWSEKWANSVADVVAAREDGPRLLAAVAAAAIEDAFDASAAHRKNLRRGAYPVAVAAACGRKLSPLPDVLATDPEGQTAGNTASLILAILVETEAASGPISSATAGLLWTRWLDLLQAGARGFDRPTYAENPLGHWFTALLAHVVACHESPAAAWATAWSKLAPRRSLRRRQRAGETREGSQLLFVGLLGTAELVQVRQAFDAEAAALWDACISGAIEQVAMAQFPEVTKADQPLTFAGALPTIAKFPDVSARVRRVLSYVGSDPELVVRLSGLMSLNAATTGEIIEMFAAAGVDLRGTWATADRLQTSAKSGIASEDFLAAIRAV